MFVGQHFKHFCRQLKNGQLDKLSAKMIKKIWTKCGFFDKAIIPVVKNAIFSSFSFPG